MNYIAYDRISAVNAGVVVTRRLTSSLRWSQAIVVSRPPILTLMDRRHKGSEPPNYVDSVTKVFASGLLCLNCALHTESVVEKTSHSPCDS